MTSDSYTALIEKTDLFKESLLILRRFREFEEFVNKNKEEKNKLESLIFQARELKTNDGLNPYAKQEELDKLVTDAEEMDEWLFSDEARDANFTTFMSKSANFSKTFSSIRNRKDEHAKRDQAISSAYDKLSSIEKTITEMNDTRPWVPELERNKSLEKVQEIRTWFNNSIEEQSKLSLSDDPALTLKDIRKKLDVAQEEVYRLRSILKEEDLKDKKKKFDGPKGGKGDGFKFKLRDLIKVVVVYTRVLTWMPKVWPRLKLSLTWIALMETSVNFSLS